MCIRDSIKGAKDAIDANLTLDNDGSALSRLKRELVTIQMCIRDSYLTGW